MHLNSTTLLIILFNATLSSLAGATSTPLIRNEENRHAALNLHELASTEDESFLVRRIAEFWKDQDFRTVKEQIQEFLIHFPKSQMQDNLKGILGDLFLQEENYQQALDVYKTIRDRKTNAQIFINKLQCYYELEQFDAIIAESEPFLKNTSMDWHGREMELQFLVAEALFRTASRADDLSYRISYVTKAKPLYEAVVHSSFNDPAMFALAEIYRLTGEPEKAVEYFQTLGERHQEKREEILFHMALAQAEYDRPLAIKTFSAIIDRDGANKEASLLNRMILYFQEEQFKEVLQTYPQIARSIKEDKKQLVQYMLGKSYFAEQDYVQADKYLRKCIANESSSLAQLRNSLLMQMTCAQNLGDEGVYANALSQFEKAFSKDQELPRALFIHAMLLKEKDRHEEAEEKLSHIITTYPNFDDRQTLFLEYSLIAYNRQEWSTAYTTLHSFLDHYPDAPQANVAWKYFVSSLFNLLKENEQEKGYVKQGFLDDLTLAMDHQDIFNDQEMRECRLLQAKLSYELRSYENAIAQLTQYLADYAQDTSIAEAHLLLARTHHLLAQHPQEFCLHAEKAMSLDPNLQNSAAIHLELYNAYLFLVENKENVNRAEFYAAAASHLYNAMGLDQTLPIPLETKLWLANYYLTSISSSSVPLEIIPAIPLFKDDENYRRTYELFTRLLFDSQGLINIDQQHTRLEWETLKFANLLGSDKNFEKKASLLRDLIQQQQLHKDWGWKMQKEVLLELAKTYECLKDYENAQTTYAFIADSYAQKATFTSEIARLYTRRLEFQLMPPLQKTEYNPRVIEILNELKGLQICKNAHSEPLHLEASLEYAWIRALVSDQKAAADRYLFFLNRIKTDFSNHEDPIVKQYHKILTANPDKHELHNLYMQFVEAEIARTEAVLAQKANLVVQSEALNRQATDRLSAFQTSNYLTHYLHRRVQDSLSAIYARKLY